MSNLSPVALSGIGFAAAVCVILAVLGFHLFTAEQQVSTAPALKTKPRSINFAEILNRFTDFFGRPFKNTASQTLGQEQKISIRKRIDSAGRPGNLTVEGYAQRKVGEVILFGSLAVLFLFMGENLFALFIAPFVFLTDLDLYVRSRQRQNAIQEQLPDFLDVLTVTVGAGLSFRQAIERVSETSPGVIAEEFKFTLQQMDLGNSRKEAFDSLRTRNTNESLGRFVSAIQQAEELGAPLTQALHEISIDMRKEDAQYTKRKAQKLNPTVTAVTTVTLLPGLILLVGGALFFGMDIDFGAMGGGL